VGERDHVFISLVYIPGVRNESEDFWRDPVNWCDAVSPGPDETEDFEGVSLENIELEYSIHQ